MAKKVKKAQRGVTGRRAAADQGSRWTVRGVPAGLQKAAGDAARARGLTLGQWLTEALEAAVGHGASAAAGATAAGWTEAVERRLERLERAVFPGAAAAAAAGPAAVN